MDISRRNFFSQVTVGAAVTATPWRLEKLSQVASQDRSSSRQSSERIRLDMNINPYGPSPKVVEVIRGNLDSVNKYPDSDYRPLGERIADFHKIKPSEVTLGCGSREVLRMAATAFLARHKTLVLASPTFGPVAGLAKRVDAQVIAVPVNKYYAHDLDAMLHHSNASTGLVYICNPNNPTGSLTPRKDLESFLEKLPPKLAVVIDEAYHEYVRPSSDYASFIDHPIDNNRVIVLRTFSKIYGLAGLRLGYAVSSKEVSLKLSLTQLERGVNIVAARAAAAALDDSDYVRHSFRRNNADRQEFYNRTNGRMLGQIDSHTNFVFMKMGLPSSQIIEHFERNNIVLGPAVPQMDKHVRVAISTEENMKEFWRVWNLQPPHSHKMATTRDPAAQNPEECVSL
jgi:histidinol-phosphate aminotransferase